MEVQEPSFTFLRACKRLPVDYTPIWFMRQAGRYMAEYRKIREKYTLLEICAIPELATEVTLQPIRAFGFDAAILFADILLPLIPMGIHLEFAAGEGPVIHNPVRTAMDVDQLRRINPHEDLAHVLKAVQLISSELAGKTPLIGFAGAPFTLASYLIEGGPSKNFLKTKGLMVEQPQVWDQLMNLLAEVVADFLLAQIDAGAQAIQLFDSWAGSALSPDDYRQFVLPYSQRIFNNILQTGVPTIHFSVGAGTYLPLLKEAGGDVIGLDWRTPIDWGRNILGTEVAVQGNLDPAALFIPQKHLKQKIQKILDQTNNQPGHIFNLGHGILPQTPVDNVKAAVEMVHELSQRKV